MGSMHYSSLVVLHIAYQKLQFLVKILRSGDVQAPDFHLFYWSSWSAVGGTSWSFDRSDWGRRHLHFLWTPCCRLLPEPQWWASPLPQQQKAATAAEEERMERGRLLKPSMLNSLYIWKPFKNSTMQNFCSWWHRFFFYFASVPLCHFFITYVFIPSFPIVFLWPSMYDFVPECWLKAVTSSPSFTPPLVRIQQLL